MTLPAGDQHFLLFDGDCGLCRFCADHARRMAARGCWRIMPFQNFSDAELLALGVTRTQCTRRLHAVSRSGRVYRGAFAVNFFLWRHPPWTLLVMLCHAVPVLLLLEIIIYAVIARYRQRLSRWLGLAVCRAPVERDGS
ncbi:MAG: DUF393 domain-containing protein [candidate division KSB1 bacterium]|nr:DUF393 domain-containing protein [candidate division KSB1 bacterium]MDZ7273480.1 DUF393 domain-containing protein [candidate division KSB1 bacterium]MDZ7286928.1 DUF393 domain-containing protein [candidate division KSB1 bacterium]MDZ7299719.1 DUF393 domain-containing protein [candidate division KSB1 bacterium]MDZ7305658.1 DUF393 domain-containing protein [candidate division KSB1 bacterium]